MVGIGQPYSLAFRRLMNWRLEPKEELGNERKRLCRKAGCQWEAAWPVGWPPFHFARARLAIERLSLEADRVNQSSSSP
jgi:hypothetical protein